MMAFRIIPYLLYFIPLVLAAGDFQLHPVRREYFCKSYRPTPGSEGLPPCDESSANPHPIEVDLRDDEQLVWSSPDAPDSAALSFTIKPYPGQRILDMARFTDDVAAADCSENMSFQFKEGSPTFQKAQESWDWVNKEEKRSFVLVGDPDICKSGNAREPWEVNHAEFDPANHVIRLAATKKEWVDVTYEYKIDFAALEKKNRPSKRSWWSDWLDRSWSDSFQLDLTTPFPEELATLGGDEDAPYKAEFSIKCPECGFFGTLLFEGHIEGSVFKGVTRADLSLMPRDVHADVNLEFIFSGSYDSEKLPPSAPKLEKAIDIAEIPLAPWSVPGILDLGPFAKLQGGVELSEAEGQAKFTTGFSMRIPDSSAVAVNFLADKTVSVVGWEPGFEAHPPTFEATISATINLFLSLTPSFDVVVFGQRGVSAQFPIKFLDLDLKVEGGYKSEGFCPPDKAPLGLSLDVEVGNSMTAEVIERKAAGLPSLKEKSKGGKVLLFNRDVKEKIKLLPPKEHQEAARSLGTHKTSPAKRDTTLFEQEIFKNEDVLPMDPWCKSFGGGEEACEIFEPRPEEQEWYDAEIASADEVDSSSKRRRQVTPRSRPHPRASGSRELTFQCKDASGDESKKFQIKPYPGPTKLMAGISAGSGSSVPIMFPKATCEEESCSNPKNWYFTDEVSNPNVVELPKSKGDKSTWSTDHIFEANWLPRFWEYMAGREGLDCQKVQSAFQVGVAGGFADKLLQRIGNSQTYKELMTLLPITENGLKHRVFAQTSPDSKFSGRSPGDKACSIGRLVSVCQLMQMTQMQERLKATIESLDVVFKEMDSTDTLYHASKDGKKYGYSKAHRDWFTDFYNKGIEFARTNIKEFAKELADDTEKFSDLPKETRDGITLMSACQEPGNCADFCPSEFEYPIKFPEEEPKPKPDEPEKPKPKPDEPGKPNPSIFPPRVTPASTPLSGWLLNVPPNYWVNNNCLDPSLHLVVDGKRTVNTQCLLVKEGDEWSDPTRAGRTSIPAGTVFDFTSLSEPNTDTCCIGLFSGTDCNPSKGQWQHVCTVPYNPDSKATEFVVHSWQVYNCKGLWEPNPYA